MRVIIFMFFLILTNSVVADDLKIGNDKVVKVWIKTKSMEISNNIFVPIGYAYDIQDSSWLCAIADANNSEHVLVLVGNGGETNFPFCTDIRNPIISKIDQNFYATYPYYVKELSDEPPSRLYHAVKLSKDGFYQCKEEEQISDAIERNLKTKMPLQKAVDNAIQKVGCTVVQ